MAKQLFENAYRQFQQGNMSESQRLCSQILTETPEHPQALCLQGMISRKAGQNATAIQFITKALEKEPANPNFWNHLGLAVQDLGHRDEAINMYRQGLAFKRNHVELLLNLSAALCNSGQSDEADRIYRQAIESDEASIDLLVNYANFLIAQNKPEEGIRHYSIALEKDPTHWLAHFNLASAYLQQANYENAIRHFEIVTQLNPTFEKAYFFLAHAHKQAGKPEQELNAYQTLANANPENGFAYLRMAVWHEAKGNVAEAIELYEKLSQLDPENALWAVRAVSIFPQLPGNQQANQLVRESLLNQVISSPEKPGNFTIQQTFEARCQPPAYIAYQGLDDCELKSRFADWLTNRLGIAKQSMPAKPRGGHAIKIGFLVTENHERVFKRVMGGYLTHFNRALFDVSIICPETRIPGLKSLFTELNDVNYIPLSSHIEQCISTLQHAGLDILFYFEIGTDVKNYLLSLYRFAPVQCTSWGYPTTSGSPNMDYYISSALIEPSNAQSHYREQLIRLENLPTCYPKPNLPEHYKNRTELNLPEEAHLYVCPQTLPKFHPDFDRMLAEILERDPDGQIILVEGLYAAWTQQLKARFQQSIPNADKRIRFLPQLAYEDYLSLIANADVMLDTLHFGGGITSYEILAIGTPVVTLPGPYMRGRYTLGCYQKMGMTDCISESESHYVELACAIATDSDYRNRIRENIRAKNSILFEDISVVREMEQCLMNLLDKAAEQ